MKKGAPVKYASHFMTFTGQARLTDLKKRKTPHSIRAVRFLIAIHHSLSLFKVKDETNAKGLFEDMFDFSRTG
jgi:hypothetical protein